MSAAGVITALPTIPWDGLWDLDDDVEMLAMLESLMRQHQPALMKLGEEWQMGWKGAKVGEIWGLRLSCPRRAIRDATERLFKKIKGLDVVNGDARPNVRLPGVSAGEIDAQWAGPIPLPTDCHTVKTEATAGASPESSKAAQTV